MSAGAAQDRPSDWVDEAVRKRLTTLLATGAVRLDPFDVLGRLDPISLLPALARTGLAVASRPDRVVAATTKAAGEAGQAGAAAIVRALGGTSRYAPARPRDKRFSDPTWTENAGYWLTRELYETWSAALTTVIAAADTTPQARQKALFAVQLLIDTLAPTNSVPGNPVVLKRALETGGLSLARGARNFLLDLATNRGMPRQVATGVHAVGQNLAVSPGKVVFRNELMELIQYTPTTPEVHEIPLLLSPPWINKYYIMDLAPAAAWCSGRLIMVIPCS